MKKSFQLVALFAIMLLGSCTDGKEQKAVEKGNLTQEQADALTEKEAIDLLFKPSFSTSDKITTKEYEKRYPISGSAIDSSNELMYGWKR